MRYVRLHLYGRNGHARWSVGLVCTEEGRRFWRRSEESHLG